MTNMLTSYFYLVRIAKSKDADDLADAISQFMEFKNDRRRQALKEYFDGLKEGDVFKLMQSAYLIME